MIPRMTLVLIVFVEDQSMFVVHTVSMCAFSGQLELFSFSWILSENQ